MMAPTKETVVKLSTTAGAVRAGPAGEVDLAGPSVEAGSYRLHVGDAVATRRNDRELRTDCGLIVKNRDQWEVHAVHHDGALSVAGRTGTVRLPADYVAEHVELALRPDQPRQPDARSTAPSSSSMGPPTPGVYVPMTRGRYSNDVLVVVEGEEAAHDVLAQALARSWIDEPAIARRRSCSTQRPTAKHDARPPFWQHGVREPRTGARDRPDAVACGVRHPDVPRGTARPSPVEPSWPGSRVSQQQRDRAQEVLNELDRPLVRRLHRSEIMRARGDLNQAQGTITRSVAELARIDASGGHPGVARPGPSHRAGPVGPRTRAPRHPAELDRDRSPPSRAFADDPPTTCSIVWVPNSAPWPTSGTGGEPRLDQHAVAFDIRDSCPQLGRSPSWEDTAIAASNRATEQACERLIAVRQFPPSKHLAWNSACRALPLAAFNQDNVCTVEGREPTPGWRPVMACGSWRCGMVPGRPLHGRARGSR